MYEFSFSVKRKFSNFLFDIPSFSLYFRLQRELWIEGKKFTKREVSITDVDSGHNRSVDGGPGTGCERGRRDNLRKREDSKITEHKRKGTPESIGR